MGVKFNLFGKSIEFSDQDVIYNKWKKYYNDLAITCADDYISKYYDKYYGLDTFSEKGLNDGWVIISQAIDTTIQNLIDLKIYNIDKNSFVKKHGQFCFSHWEDAFKQINDKYLEIVLNEEELDEYRTQRRQNRGKIIGGGFGFSGAAKGMMAAGAVNMASGAIHGTANIIGKGVTSISNSNKKSSIYKNEATKEVLWGGIYSSVYAIHYVLCNILCIPTLGNDEAKILFNNIDRMKQEDIKENIIKIISLNPYLNDIYIYSVKNFGDKNNEITKVSNFFGNDIEPFKHDLLKEKYSYVDISSEEKTIETKENLMNDMSFYGLKNSDILVDLDQKLLSFDRYARTVGHILFDTREEANEANNEFMKVKDILGTNYKDDIIKAKEALEKIKQAEFNSSIGEKYIEFLEKIIIQLDIASRTYSDVVFDTKEDSELAKIEDDKLRSIMKSKLSIPKKLEQIESADFKTKIKEKYIKLLESSFEDKEKQIEEYESDDDSIKTKKGLLGQAVLVLAAWLLLQNRFGWIGKIIIFIFAIGLTVNIFEYFKHNKIKKELNK